MKLLVFGATGRTGLPLVRQALDAGHEVIAFARTPSKLNITHPKLTVIQGDMSHSADIERAFNGGIDAVIAVHAPTRQSAPDMLENAARDIVGAMKKNGVKRIIYMTGAGVDMPGDRPKPINHVIKFALKTLAGDVLKQSEAAVRIVTGSGLDYVILRAPMLTDAPHTGQYRVGMVGVNTGPRLARADAADFILKQLNGTAYLRQAPVVSN